MINRDAKKCLNEDCLIQPRFNNPGETVGIYCENHKTPIMENVVDKECLFTDCKSRPRYNFPTEAFSIYCKSHKLDGMRNVYDIVCQESGCETIPVYNISGESKGIYCLTHKTQEMIDVVSKRCETYMCGTTTSNPRYKGYCIGCFINVFPGAPNPRNYKIKENHVADFVKEQFPEEIIVFDKIVAGGCSKRRPDILIDKGTHVVVVECDEHQHQSTTCENKRMAEIFRDVGVPVVFIRFNPDSYRDNSVKIPSCFKILEQTGIQVIASKKEWESRLLVLKTTLQENLTEIPEKSMTTINLFYDK